MTPSFVMPDADLVRSRAKVLAGEHRTMRSELIRLREAAGLTQAQVGELIGVSQQAIQKLERYDADPKLSTIRRYANAVGALIEHRVTADLGQSLLSATGTPWEAVGTLASSPVRAARVVTPRTTQPVRTGWTAADSKRTDFALSA